MSLICPSCASSLHVQDKDTHGATCQECGLIIDASSSYTDPNTLTHVVPRSTSSSARKRCVSKLSAYLSSLHLSVNQLLSPCCSLLDEFLHCCYGTGNARWMDVVCIAIIYLTHRRCCPEQALILGELADMIQVSRQTCSRMIHRIKQQTQGTTDLVTHTQTKRDTQKAEHPTTRVTAECYLQQLLNLLDSHGHVCTPAAPSLQTTEDQLHHKQQQVRRMTERLITLSQTDWEHTEGLSPVSICVASFVCAVCHCDAAYYHSHPQAKFRQRALYTAVERVTHVRIRSIHDTQNIIKQCVCKAAQQTLFTAVSPNAATSLTKNIAPPLSMCLNQLETILQIMTQQNHTERQEHCDDTADSITAHVAALSPHAFTSLANGSAESAAASADDVNLSGVDLHEFDAELLACYVRNESEVQQINALHSKHWSLQTSHKI